MAGFINQHFLYILLAVATAFGYFWLSQFKEKLRISEWMALLLAVLHTVVGVLCVKVFAFMEGEPGGMSLFGAIFFLPALYALAAFITKRKAADIFDVFTISVIFTLLCARLNCLKAGCCLGNMIFETELRWPTRELEIIFYLILIGWLGKKAGKAKFSGKLYPIYMMAYGAFRFVEEWFRETKNSIGIFHISHIWALVSIAVGAGIYYKLTKVDPKRKAGKLARS